MDHNRKRSETGSSVIEVMIGFSILAIALVGTITIVFGGQTASLDTSLTERGQYLNTSYFEQAVASVRAAWGGSSSVYDGFYTKGHSFKAISPCSAEVTASTTWTTEKNRGQRLGVSTLVASSGIAALLGGDCDPFPPLGNWEAPSVYPITDPIFSGSPASDIDGLDRPDGTFALVTTWFNPSPTADTLWMVDVSDLSNVVLADSYMTPDDLLAIDATLDFAFVGGATSTLQKPFWIFDISDEGAIAPVANLALPNTYAADFNNILAVHYYAGRIYVGTNYMAFGTPTHDELHIYEFDEIDPAHPVWKTSINVDRTINDIFVRDGLAYLATGPGGDNTVMKIYDVDPLSGSYGSLVGEYAAPTAQAGIAIDVLGDYAYLGRERPNGSGTTEDLFIVLDISDPTDPVVTDATDLNIAKGTAVTGIEVRGNIAFMVTSDQNGNNQTGNIGDGPFMMYDISDPTNILLNPPCVALNWSEKSTGMDMMNDLIFISNESNDALRVIYPLPACTP